MDNLSQASSLIDSANQANALAQDQIDRIQDQKQKKLDETQEAKDAFAQAGELLGGGLIEKSAENLIKKGVRLGRNKMKALGIDADEVEKMALDYKENGSSGLISGIVKRGGIKTKEQLNSFINAMKGKMEGSPAVSSSKLLTDDFGLPVTKADLPPDAPIVSSTLTKGGDEFRPSRALDPDFSTSKFRAKIDPSTGSVNIVNNETGELASDAEIRGYDENLISRLKKVSGYEEPPDPLETASPQTVKALSAKFDSYFNDGNEGAKPLSSDAFDFKAPPAPKPSLPKPSTDTSRFGVGDAENLPSQFKKADYSSDLKGVRDYGKQISRAFLGGKQDEIRGRQLKQRIIDLKERKSNLDSDSLRAVYKEKIDGKQPRVKKVNGEPDLDSLENNLNFREKAMNETEQFQGIARQSESSIQSGFAKSRQQLFDEQLPPVPKGGAEVTTNPTLESANEPPPVNDDTIVKPIGDFGSPNVGSTSGSFKIPSISITEPDISPDAFKPPPVSNEIPIGTKVSADTTKGALSEAVTAAGETDVALGGVEDPVGDVISAVVGIGTLIGSLVGDKPKKLPPPPAPPQIRSTFQIGQDI